MSVQENKPVYEYQVALSFAGEDRQYAERLAELLKQKNIIVFYDRYEQADLWGRDLYQHLQSVYRDKAQYCIVFVSEAYLERGWTRHELKQMQARAFRENREYILPIRLDDAIVPGINETVGYIDLRSESLENIASSVEEKLRRVADVIESDLSSESNIAEGSFSKAKAGIPDWNFLREILVERLEREELINVCYALLIPRESEKYDELKELPPGSMARGLLEHIRRRERIDDLIKYLKQKRPDVYKAISRVLLLREIES